MNAMEIIILVLLAVILMVFAVPFSMVGQGGGVAYVPLLEIAGIGTGAASTISLFMIAAVSVSAVLVFHSKKAIDWMFLLYIVPAAVVGSFLGGYIAHLINAPIFTVIFAAVLCMAAFLIFKHDYSKAGQSHVFMPKLLVWKRAYGEYNYSVPLGILIPVMAMLGFIAGMLGIGGGLFLLPVLVLLFRVPMRITIGVSSVYVGFTALLGLAGHIAGGDVLSMGIAIPLAVAVFIGASVGSQMSHKTSLPNLKAMLAIILVGLAVAMLLKVL